MNNVAKRYTKSLKMLRKLGSFSAAFMVLFDKNHWVSFNAIQSEWPEAKQVLTTMKMFTILDLSWTVQVMYFVNSKS